MLLWINQIFGFPWGITLLYLYPKCGMTAEIWRIRRAARQAMTSGSNLIQIGVNAVFSSSAKQPTFLGFKFDFAAPVQCMALLFLLKVYKICHWDIIFCTGSQCRRYGEARGAVPPNDCLCPPILVHSECFFGASRNDKTTGNNGKRNNNFETWFSFEVFSIVCKIAGHQLLHINVTQ